MGRTTPQKSPAGWLLATAAAWAMLGPVPAALAQAPTFATTAPIAYMVDLGSGRVLFSRDADRRFVPASLTKIMTAFVAFEMIAEGTLDPRQTFTVSDEAFRKWARVGSTMYLARGAAVPVDALLTGIMTVSANDGSIVFAEGASGSVAAFVERMNATARELGMKNSRFGTPNGWPDQGATYTTAADLALLTRAMITRHPELYRRYVGHPSMEWNGVRQNNHIPVLGLVPGADGVKTGFTNEAGYGFVGSAERDGRRLVMVLAGFDNPRARGRESRAFLEWGFRAWQSRRLVAPGQIVSKAKVQLGAMRSVPLVAPMPYHLTFAPGEPTAYRLRLRYHGPLRAPLAGGDQVAELIVAVPGQGEHRLPLFTARPVAAAGFWARLRNGLLGLFGL